MRNTLFLTEYPSLYRNSPKYWVQEFLTITQERFPSLDLKRIDEFKADGRYVALMIANPQDKEALEDLVQWTVIPIATGGRRKLEKAWAQFLMDNTHLVRIS